MDEAAGDPITSSGIAFDGGAGANTLSLFTTEGDDSVTVGRVDTVAAITLNSSHSINLPKTQNLFFQTGGGNDTVTIKDVFSTSVTGISVDLGSGNDLFNGALSTIPLVVYAGAGTDVISAGRGDEVIYGGTGNKTIYGGIGNQIIYGGNGTNTIYGGIGPEVICGGTDNTTIYGGIGTEAIYKGAGKNTITKGIGKQTLYDASKKPTDLVSLASSTAGTQVLNAFQQPQHARLIDFLLDPTRNPVDVNGGIRIVL